jgi:pyruvate kinase
MDEQAYQDLLNGVAGEVTALRDRVAADGKALYRSWRGRIERSSFAPSALNLAHYLVLRQADLRLLQRRLMALGLSSLGRAEGRVLAVLDAVDGALGRMRRRPAAECRRVPNERQFFRGERLLFDNAAEALGPASKGRAGRIMVTLGTEAADHPGVFRDLAGRGVDLVRINCAHDNQDIWARMIENVRLAAQGGGRMRVLMDIAGPKVRTGEVYSAPERDRLKIGDEILLCRAIDPGALEFPFQSTCTLPAVFERIKVGDRISIDDGALRGTVARQTPAGLVARIEDGTLRGMRLKAQKSLLFPTVDLGLEPLSDQDRTDLDFVARHADLIGYSFVETAEHVAALQDELKRRRPDWTRICLVAKIETPRAVANLPEIIVQAAGRQPLAVMIARGDLAIELGFERLAEMQEEILWLCEAADVPAIWATQVLEGLIKKGMPSRGEMTDAAMAGRAECVMLNKGPNVGVAIEALDRLLRRMGEHQIKKTPTLRALKSWARVSGIHRGSRPS